MSTQAKPPVVTWFKAYCCLFVVIYLGVAAFSLVFFLGDPAELDTSREEAVVIGTLFLLIGLLFSAASLLPLFLPPRPWLWIYDLIIICLGLTSVCSLPMSIPLLIFWLKPECKLYFGRSVPAAAPDAR